MSKYVELVCCFDNETKEHHLCVAPAWEHINGEVTVDVNGESRRMTAYSSITIDSESDCFDFIMTVAEQGEGLPKVVERFQRIKLNYEEEES